MPPNTRSTAWPRREPGQRNKKRRSPPSLQTHASFGSLHPPCFRRRSPACPALHTSSCTQISPVFTEVTETLFSIIVKQQNFTKHLTCQRQKRFFDPDAVFAATRRLS